MFDIFNKKVIDFNDSKSKNNKKDRINSKDNEIEIIKRYIEEAIRKTNPSSVEPKYHLVGDIEKVKRLFIFKISGGENGAGKWSKYFQDLSIFTKVLESKAKDVFAINVQCDYSDDVFWAEFAFQMK